LLAAGPEGPVGGRTIGDASDRVTRSRAAIRAALARRGAGARSPAPRPWSASNVTASTRPSPIERLPPRPRARWAAHGRLRAARCTSRGNPGTPRPRVRPCGLASAMTMLC